MDGMTIVSGGEEIDGVMDDEEAEGEEGQAGRAKDLM